jgi:hypothetical protein
MTFFRATFTSASAILMLSAPAFAQNTSSVSGANIVAGQTELGYRAAYAIEDGGDADAFAHRLHYQQALDEDWRVRAIILQSDRGGEFEVRSVQLEVQKQFVEGADHHGWNSAIRVDGLIPTEDDRPGRARIGWLNGLDLGRKWQVRANLYLAREIGENARRSLMVEARAEATYKLPSGTRIGLQSFNTARTADLFAQRRQLGLVVKGKLTESLSYETGALFGLSADASDAEFRLFLAYDL